MRLSLFLLTVLMVVFSLTYGQDKPKKPHELYEEAEAAYNEGKNKEALALLDQCLQESAGYFEAYSMRGSVKELLRDLDGALTDYSIYLEHFPENLEVLMSRAVLRYRLGFYQQAKDDFLKLLTMDASETNVVFYKLNTSVGDKNPVTTPQSGHKAYVFNYLGLTEAKLKRHTDAMSYFDSAIRLHPREPDYYVNRGLTKEALNNSTASADYETALKLNPRHTLARHNLSSLRSKDGKEVTYEDRLTETISEDSTMLYPYLERALQRFESGYYKGAEEDYTNALQIDESNEEIWLGRGLAREKQKDFEGAFSDYTRAIDIKEDFFKAWINRGNVLFKLERYSDAIEDFNVALIYQGDYAPAFYNRAMAKVKLKNKAEACEDIKQAEHFGMKVESKVKAKICD